MNRTKDLAYWINEREHMRMRKENELEVFGPPYSVDRSMAGVRYCNVHREDDKVTRWVRDNWRNPNSDSPLLTLGMVAARMINWPDTLEEVKFPWPGDKATGFQDWSGHAKAVIRERQRDGLKAWTSAYTISTCGRSMKKEDYVFDHVLQTVAKMDWFGEPIGFTWTLALAHQRLTLVDGLGSFLAAQVVADLKNTPGHPLASAPDFWTWSAPGPGSLRGLEAYFETKISPSGYQYAIKRVYDEVIPELYPYVTDKGLHMQDLQNCLCEFSKYMRVKEGDGRVRNKYSPG